MPKEEAETPKVEEKPLETPEAKPEEKPISKEEYEELRSQLTKTQDDYKNIQRVVSKKDEELSKLKDRRDFEEAMLAAIAEQKGQPISEVEQDVRQRTPDLKQQYEILRQRRKQEEYQEKVQSYQRTVEGELGLRPTDDDYDIIQALVVAGKFEKADRKIEALRTKPEEKPKEEPKESEEERIERLAKAKAAELLKSESGEPSSGTPKSLKEVAIAYSEGKVTRKDYEKAKREAGIS
jgi:hypothetical protein